MISEVTLGGLLYGAAARHPDRTAVVFPGTRQTYAELRERVASWSRLLLALDVAQGEHVGIFMTNEPEYIELLFANSDLAGLIHARPVTSPVPPERLSEPWQTRYFYCEFEIPLGRESRRHLALRMVFDGLKPTRTGKVEIWVITISPC